jgi:hypothetical protein
MAVVSEVWGMPPEGARIVGWGLRDIMGRLYSNIGMIILLKIPDIRCSISYICKTVINIFN